MQVETVEFRNRRYRLRLIDFGEGWGNYFVGSTQLLDGLWDDDRGYTCSEAVAVDELIFYYVPTHYFKLSDRRLRKQILSEIG